MPARKTASDPSTSRAPIALLGRRHQAMTPAVAQIQNTAVNDAGIQYGFSPTAPSPSCTTPSTSAENAMSTSASRSDPVRPSRSRAGAVTVAAASTPSSTVSVCTAHHGTSLTGRSPQTSPCRGEGP